MGKNTRNKVLQNEVRREKSMHPQNSTQLEKNSEEKKGRQVHPSRKKNFKKTKARGGRISDLPKRGDGKGQEKRNHGPGSVTQIGMIRWHPGTFPD